MALNLSDLTSPSTSGDVLAELTTTADFLDSVPVLRNLASGSNKAGNAKQGTALSQPKALPLIDGEGYCYLPPVAGNYASTPDDSSLDITGDITIDVDLTCADWNPSTGSYIPLVQKYEASGDQRGYLFWITPNGILQFYLSEDGTSAGTSSALSSSPVPFSAKQRGQLRVSWSNATNVVQFFTSTNQGQTWTQLGNDSPINKTGIYNNTAPIEVGRAFGYYPATGTAIHSINIYDSVTPSSSSLRFNCDFTSPRIPHGATKFACETGQVVTVNTSGNNPASIIKKPVLRFDGVDDLMKGVLGQTITEGGYAFAAFSVLGDTGNTWARVLSFNPTGGDDYQNGGAIFITKNNNTNNLSLPTGAETGMFDDANGDILVEAGRGTNYRKSRVNDASVKSQVAANTMSFDEFNLGAAWSGGGNTSIDLEYLAVFPASLTDSQADQVRNYINNRNKVFDRWDTDGYYFFDPQKATFVGDFSASNTLDGYITGSDNGDTDVRSNLTLEQAVIGNAQPSTDGYTITFSDNAEFLNFTNGASQSLAGWQIVGTSVGTFAYKVNANAVTEINLLGNLGGAAYRQAGDLYGIILLPETATNRDIEEARQLLISRGAADGVTASSLISFWRDRVDIVEFKSANASNVSNFFTAWLGCLSLQTFGLVDTSNGENFSFTWYNCTSLESLALINISKGKTFNASWLNCNSLELFPAGMFDSWNPTSISHNVFDRTWDNCTSLTPQSVENILVSIATSGKYATTSGASGGTALTDPEIDIDYNGAGLTPATNTAIETLNGRGWRVKINGEIIVPNILQLQPAAAYSLRSFDPDADPNVVNVRRSSDNSTSDFTASQVSDGTLEAWVGAGNDGYVTTWYDQSGSGNDSTQSTASSQPLIVDSGVLVTENGEAALDINRTPLVLTSTISCNDLTWFTVTKKADSGAIHSIIFDGNSGSNYGGDDVNSKGNPVLVQSSDIISTGKGNTSASGGEVNQHLSYYNRNGNNASGGLNGEINTEAVVITPVFDLVRLFKYSSPSGSLGFDYVGKAQEIVVFNTDQSANRAAIEKNINDHYSIY